MPPSIMCTSNQVLLKNKAPLSKLGLVYGVADPMSSSPHVMASRLLQRRTAGGDSINDGVDRGMDFFCDVASRRSDIGEVDKRFGLEK